MSTSAQYSIKDLEVLTEIKSHTIRIWEKRYGILTPSRTDTNIRHYDNDDLRKLLNVSILNQNGYKISRIADMPGAAIRELVQELTLGKSNNSNLIDGLIVGMIDLDEVQLNKVFDAAVARIGFERTILDVVFPFFHRIGIMWQIGVINPAQEHFFSHFIRQKIIYATELLSYNPNPSLPKIVLFLPGNELHEFGLLLYNYALRSRGYATVYLSQAVPIESMTRIVEITQPDILVCTVTNPVDSAQFRDTVLFLSRAFSGMILMSGKLLSSVADNLPENIRPFENLDSLLSVVAASTKH